MILPPPTFRQLLPVLVLGTISLATAQSAPPLETIIQQVVARDEANQKQLQTMEYHETLRAEQLDPKGAVTKQQKVEMIIRPGADHEVQVLSASGSDLPSDPDEAARQAKGQEMGRKKMTFALKDMASRFKITLAGTGMLEGVPVYIIAFEPKPNQPFRDQTEKVLNHLQGRMWIATRDSAVLKTEATLAAPVQIAWVFAQVTALSFRYELHNTTGGMGPASIQTSVQVDAPFIAIHQGMTIDMADFHPRTEALAGAK